MSFLVAAALAIGLFVVVPIAAHLLRRGRSREQDFPPALLVPAVPPVARQRSRLEDRVLLAVRVAIVSGLALLGATPLVRCSRLCLTRNAGASVAIAIVLDDSLSMRAVVADKPRFSQALEGARELVALAREGDAVAIVLAGRPARLLLAATTDLGAARAALDEVEPTDRSTDLEGAVQIARSSLKALPHVDKRVALLSDLAGAPVPPGEPPAWAPLEPLRRTADDCGIVSAERRGRHVTAVVACTAAAAAAGRTLELHAAEGASATPTDGAASGARGSLGSTRLAAQAGAQTLSIELGGEAPALDVKLSGGDALEQDDLAPVALEAALPSAIVVSDPATGAVSTGGSTVLEQALSALGAEIAVQPMPVLPDEKKELEGRALVLLDDPSGLAPEARLALTGWLERGGVAAALLGPRAATAQLGSTLEPFVQGGVRWEEARGKGAAPATLAWLGAEAESLAELGARGRARLSGAEPPGARTIGRWDDGEPLLFERSVGRGRAFTIGLPSSVDQSDLALRPGFLALLQHLVDESARHVGPRRSVAGEPWLFASSPPLEVLGPAGALAVRELSGVEGGRQAVPEQRGRYEVVLGDERQTRIVTIEANEVTDAPRTLEAASAESGPGSAALEVDTSRELALLIAGLLALELGLRAFARFGRTQRPEVGRERRRAA